MAVWEMKAGQADLPWAPIDRCVCDPQPQYDRMAVVSDQLPPAGAGWDLNADRPGPASLEVLMSEYEPLRGGEQKRCGMSEIVAIAS